MKRKKSDNLYNLDGYVPVGQAIPFGFQHLLAMFVANITPVMILADTVGLDEGTTAGLVRNAMIIAGLATVVQVLRLWRIGARLPMIWASVSHFSHCQSALPPHLGWMCL